MVHQDSFTLHTRGHRDMHDITQRVQAIVSNSGIHTGIVQVFHLGSTAAVGIVEFEPGLQQDIPDLLDRLIPASRNYGHEQTWHDGNGHSHLQATLLGQGLTVPVKDGKLWLGTWQQIFLLECDIHARERAVAVTVVGE
ncbi:MAG TPA: secondary thiamine-phosphate synthase enzyme YjbQ [Gemmataceae bacterium]|nr:secondary thiamine-phosphate synthase enzyme YjbQ [Gemmataceae bacterium]